MTSPTSLGRLNHGHVYDEQVGATEHGLALLELLCRRHPHSTRAEWAERIRRGEIDVGQRTAEPDQRLAAGERIVWRRPPWTEPEVPLRFTEVYRDDALLVVDKPSGLPTAPAGGFLEHTLLALVQREAPDWAPMHRLGRATSGLLLFARGSTARSRVQAAFRARAVEKRYLALATGAVAAPQVLRFPIGPRPHPRLGTVHAATADGRAAETHVEAAEPHAGASRVQLKLITGRPHRIRIHLAAAGHPLVGDPLYGVGGGPLEDAPGLPGDSGYLLHAWQLAFRHPLDDRALAFAAAIPDGLR